MKFNGLTKFTMFLGGAVMLVGLSTTAFALTLSPTMPPSDVTSIPSDVNGGNDITLLETLMPGMNFSLAYKGDTDPMTTEGPFDPAYTISFGLDGMATDDWDSFEINFIGMAGDEIDCSAAGSCQLVVKDGNQMPARFIFDLGGGTWNGTEQIVGSGFWSDPTQGSISHVGIYTKDGTGNGPGGDLSGTMPEPATTLLIGSGLLGFGLWRWSHKK
ncbi:MAG: PEP-CTERM sorting domain-containing protein [Nitrospirota bacterium]|nr:PEP-CTERM sorting domain-containing protein [Nitrospirota bacterium]